MASPGEGEGGASEGGVEWVEVDSSAVESVGFDEEAGTIYVVFRRGGEYSFSGDREAFEGLTVSASVGRAVNELMGHAGMGGKDVGV